MTNFTLLDIFGILRVLPFFALIFLAPGYCLGRASNVLGFRQRSAAEQWLLSMGLSIVVMPIALNLLSRWIPLGVTVPLCWLLAVIAAGDLLLRWRRDRFSIAFSMRRSTTVAIGLAILWAVICLVSLPDLQLGQRLYSTAAVADLGVRSAFVASAMHGGAPPANPFFFPGSIVKLRYYYYWYVMTAVPGVAAGVQPRAALFASSIWSGWLISAAAALFLKHFYSLRRRIRTASVVAVALLGVTGLDVLPILLLYLKYRMVFSDMEVWDTDQITSWTNSLLWVPHHVAATSACMLGFVFLWHAGKPLEHTPRQRVLLALLAAMGFASAAGLSVYVTFAFALFLFVAALFWLATRRFNTVGLYIGVGAVVLLLSAGYLHDLRATDTHAGEVTAGLEAPTKQPPFFATFGLRQLPPTLMLALRRAVHDNKLANILLRPFLLVPVLFLELGFFFLVAVRQGRLDWRQDWRPDQQQDQQQRSIHATAHQTTPVLRDIRWLTWLMLASGLWVALMMRSTVITNNDLSFRGVEVAQFILLLWGAAQIAGARPETDLLETPTATPSLTEAAPTRLRIGWLVGSLLVLGVISSGYQLVMLRFYLYGSDRYNWTNPVIPQSEFGGRFGSINKELRDAYASLDRVLPPSAKVQFGAAPKLDLQHLFYSRYQQLNGMFPGCGIAFGGSMAQCFQLETRIAPLFGIPPLSGADYAAWTGVHVPTLTTAADVYSLCRDLDIDALVVTGEDPVWNDPNGWPHQIKPVFASDFVAAYTCR
ncbi:MAG TPA: hypothetical protein VNY74_05110 [Edaphobacter sp.]|jgi:hypothetical protein|nr:hypothetical protein [Edaphobacter sp.]